MPWGVPLPGADYLVHPAPLYDMAFNLIWFAILISMRDHKWMQDGNLLKFGIAGYALFRFFEEFVRNNRVLAFGLTGRQFASAILFVWVIVYFMKNKDTLFVTAQSA